MSRELRGRRAGAATLWSRLLDGPAGTRSDAGLDEIDLLRDDERVDEELRDARADDLRAGQVDQAHADAA